MQDDTLSIIPWRERSKAFGYYLGAAPVAYFFKTDRRSAFLQHHLMQSLALFSMILFIGAAFVLAVLALTYVMVYHRALYDLTHPEPHTLNVSRKLVLCWAVFWMFGAGLVLRGSSREMPLVAFLTRRARLQKATACTGVALYLVLLTLLPVTLHAASLTRQDAAPGKVYLLYEDIDRFPRWIFMLGFYRISLTAEDRWGAGHVVALRLTEDSLKRALKEGQFVFIGSHGMKEGLLLKSGFILPDDIRKWGVNRKLRFVYLTSCDSGAQKEAWERTFAPATVVTYGRLTATIEHIWWLWSQGPRIIHSMNTD